MQCHYSCVKCSIGVYANACLICASGREFFQTSYTCICTSGTLQVGTATCLDYNTMELGQKGILKSLQYGVYGVMAISWLIIMMQLTRYHSFRLKKLVDAFQLMGLALYYRHRHTWLTNGILHLLDGFNFGYVARYFGCRSDMIPHLCYDYYSHLIAIGIVLGAFIVLSLISYCIVNCWVTNKSVNSSQTTAKFFEVVNVEQGSEQNQEEESEAYGNSSSSKNGTNIKINNNPARNLNADGSSNSDGSLQSKSDESEHLNKKKNIIKINKNSENSPNKDQDSSSVCLSGSPAQKKQSKPSKSSGVSSQLSDADNSANQLIKEQIRASDGWDDQPNNQPVIQGPSQPRIEYFSMCKYIRLYWVTIVFIYLDITTVATTLSLSRATVQLSWIGILLGVYFVFMFFISFKASQIMNSAEQYKSCYRIAHWYLFLYDSEYHRYFVGHLYDNNVKEQANSQIIKTFTNRLLPYSNLMIFQLWLKTVTAATLVFGMNMYPQVVEYIGVAIMLVYMMSHQVFYIYQNQDLLFFLLCYAASMYAVSGYWLPNYQIYLSLLTLLPLCLLVLILPLMIAFDFRKETRLVIRRQLVTNHQIANIFLSNLNEGALSSDSRRITFVNNSFQDEQSMDSSSVNSPGHYQRGNKSKVIIRPLNDRFF